MSLIERYLNLELPKEQSCFLWGARKTGKSTYLQEKFPRSVYINLLHSELYHLYLNSPQHLEQQIKANPNNDIIIIDKVQKVPILLDEIHRLIESYKNKKFILCGSSARRLKQKGANLLGGRAWRFLFVPFCYPELRELNWHRIFNHGLIPSHYLSSSRVVMNKRFEGDQQ